MVVYNSDDSVRTLIDTIDDLNLNQTLCSIISILHESISELDKNAKLDKNGKTDSEDSEASVELTKHIKTTISRLTMLREITGTCYIIGLIYYVRLKNNISILSYIACVLLAQKYYLDK